MSYETAHVIVLATRGLRYGSLHRLHLQSELLAVYAAKFRTSIDACSISTIRSCLRIYNKNPHHLHVIHWSNLLHVCEISAHNNMLLLVFGWSYSCCSNTLLSVPNMYLIDAVNSWQSSFLLLLAKMGISCCGSIHHSCLRNNIKFSILAISSSWLWRFHTL